jgi:two-component system chemotaxis response regulator CheY
MAKEILLIDDDADELEVFTDALLLIDESLRSFQAKNLEEAMTYLETTSPAFVFIDFNMPKVNGLECLSALKESGKVEKARNILYSNHITETMKQRAIELGAFNCIQKPTTIIELSEKLIAVLKD